MQQQSQVSSFLHAQSSRPFQPDMTMTKPGHLTHRRNMYPQWPFPHGTSLRHTDCGVGGKESKCNSNAQVSSFLHAQSSRPFQPDMTLTKPGPLTLRRNMYPQWPSPHGTSLRHTDCGVGGKESKCNSNAQVSSFLHAQSSRPFQPEMTLTKPGPLTHRRNMYPQWPSHGTSLRHTDCGVGGKESKCNSNAQVSSFLHAQSSRPFQPDMTMTKPDPLTLRRKCTHNGHSLTALLCDTQALEQAVRNPSATAMHKSPASYALYPALSNETWHDKARLPDP